MRIPGRISRLLLLALALGTSYGAGYLSHDAAPAVLARLAAWSERPADPGRAPVPAELGRRKAAYFERLKGGGR